MFREMKSPGADKKLIDYGLAFVVFVSSDVL